MKPITFENLRRLIGGRRKNKDRNESPFKRSESFKRISIRRNYLDNRGQKGRNPTKRPLPDPVTGGAATTDTAIVTTTSTAGDSQRKISSEVAAAVVAAPKTAAAPPRSAVPLPELPRLRPAPSPRKDDDHGDDDVFVSLPPAESKRRSVTPPPPSSSPPPSPPAVQVIDYGEWIRCIRAEEDLNHLKRSRSPPTPPARYRYKELDDSSRADSAISLGRIWMDAPSMSMAPAAPRSLELPGRPAAMTDNERRAHHSLESALKDKQRDDRPAPGGRRFHRYPVDTKMTASRSSMASTCSGKDSGFSVSAPGLSDPPQPSRQLFRKKAPSRRPAQQQQQQAKSIAGSVVPSHGQAAQELYQVVVARSPLRQLKLDPMMFVPPEKRRSAAAASGHNKSSSSGHKSSSAAGHKWMGRGNRTPVVPLAAAKRSTVVEIRDYCVPKDVRVPTAAETYDEDNYNDGSRRGDRVLDDRLYESISKGRGRWQESTDDADTEDDAHRTSVRNRVKRKKSARRNIKYVVKPVRRAPSAATRKPSVTAKSKAAWITTSTCAMRTK